MFTSRLISRRMRVGLTQIRFREDVSNFIGPTSIVLDDLVSDMRHRVDSGSYVYLSAKGSTLVFFQQTTFPISSSHSLDDSMRSVRSIEFVADLVDGFNFPSAAQGCRR